MRILELITEDDLDKFVNDFISASTSPVAQARVSSTPLPAAGSNQHVVAAGETIYSLARSLNIDPAQLYQLNGMDRTTKLTVGQTIRIPARTAAKATTSAPVVAKPLVKPPAPAKPVAAPVSIPQTPGSVAWQTIHDYLHSKGISQAHIIGMLANIQHESSFRPNVQVVDSNGLPSGGLFQWNGPRFAGLKQALGKRWGSDWQGQIDFALSEPDGRRYLSNRFKTPHDASKWWTINFERPAKAQATAQTRAKSAGQFQMARK